MKAQTQVVALLIGLTTFLIVARASKVHAQNAVGIYPVPSACAAPIAPTGRSFYVDPSAGRMSNDGSAGAPWSTLSALINAGHFADGAIKPGDTVYLRSGDHGSITLSGDNSDFIATAAHAGSTPVVSGVSIAGSRWVIKGLTIQKLSSTLVDIRNSASNNIVVGNHILSQQDVSSWTQADWRRKSSTAVSIYGQCTTILDNKIENVRWGVLEAADHELIYGQHHQ